MDAAGHAEKQIGKTDCFLPKTYIAMAKRSFASLVKR